MPAVYEVRVSLAKLTFAAIENQLPHLKRDGFPTSRGIASNKTEVLPG